MNKQIIKAAQMASKVGHQAGAKKAHADNKASYMDREGKTTVKRQPDGSYKKSVIKTTPEQNQTEYDREKNEKFYSKKTGKLEYIPTDDGEVQDRSGIEKWQLAPDRKSSPINHCSSDMMHSQSWNEMRKRSNVKSPLNMVGIGVSRKSRCWEGYEPTPGVKAYDKGSCRKK
tara:strand:- start:276 stop:791 length:516 start_codon:yes stop_codon:yes gene_type:complete